MANQWFIVTLNNGVEMPALSKEQTGEDEERSPGSLPRQEQPGTRCQGHKDGGR